MISLGLLSAHCKGDDDETVDARRDFITDYCRLLQPCCQGAGYSGRACEGEVSSGVPRDFDPASGRACLDAVRAASAGADFCLESILRVNDACTLLARRGDVPLGGECHDAATGIECAPSPEGQVTCAFGDGRAVCQLQTLVADEGAECIEDSNEDGTLPRAVASSAPATDRGSYCDRTKGLFCNYTTHRCEPRVPVGGACPVYTSCVAGAYCNSDTDNTDNCAPRKANGAACLSDLECASGACDLATRRCADKKWPYLAELCGQ